jgi:hypothetical protein
MTVREVRGNWIHHLEFDGFRLARPCSWPSTAARAPRSAGAPHRVVDIAALDLRGVT